jgi:hypothetical protein
VRSLAPAGSLVAAAVLALSCAGFSSDPYLIGQGDSPAGTWRVEATIRDGNSVCISTRFPGSDGASSGCHVDEVRLPITTHGSSGSSGNPKIVRGLTTADVATIRLELREGVVAEGPTVIVPILRDMPLSKRAFAIPIDEFGVVLAISALDGAGNALYREETGRSPF